MKSLRILLAAAALMTLGALTSTPASAGCYRLGPTGYHWYRYCFGPRFMYPHRRACHWRHGYRHCFYY